MFAPVTTKELYRFFLLELQKLYGLGEATSITDWVFEKMISLKKADIIRNPRLQVPQDAETRIRRCLEALMQHQPVQYVLGETESIELKRRNGPVVSIPGHSLTTEDSDAVLQRRGDVLHVKVFVQEKKLAG